MSKKVLIISTSLRNNANSEILAHETERGARDAGCDVEFVTLKDKTINFCKGCLACQKIGHCVINDDANAITEKMKEADVIVWATPVYYYEMAGQMKTMIDRANTLFSTGHNFKEIYLIATAADGSQCVAQTVINGLNGWIACFSEVKFCGYVEGGGQMLIAIGGRGYYQEWGKEPVEMMPGDVINIPANVKHWHGAAPDSWFSHIAVEIDGVETTNEWLEAVTDEQYNKLK